MPEQNITAHRILDAAECYTQTRGFNAFSYKDIQRDVGIKTSSIHYYFPTKHELARVMAERYTLQFRKQLTDSEAHHTRAIKRIEDLIQIYLSTAEQGKFCLCGMLASDIAALPKAVHHELGKFFSLVEDWLASTISLAQDQGDIKKSVNCTTAAAHFLATLEGGMLVARAHGRSDYLKKVTGEALNSLQG